MYADTITRSMKYAIDETNRRRDLQQKFNQENGITPTTIRKNVYDVIEATQAVDNEKKVVVDNKKDIQKAIAELTVEMKKAAELLQFELAAQIRDEIRRLQNEIEKE